LAPGASGRRSKPESRSSAYCDQLIDLPNSPSLGISMPSSTWRRTMSFTDCARQRSYAGRSYGARVCRARMNSSSAGGRIRLPT
jgi:hypothetical protein